MANCDFSAVDIIGKNEGLTNLSPSAEKVNPAASGKANGADQLGISFKTKKYRLRAERATTLCMAIADCDPRESLQILAAALEDMSRGSPLPVLLSPMEDARWWASFAQPNELKSYAVACFEAMAPKVQVSFLAHVQRGASA